MKTSASILVAALILFPVIGASRAAAGLNETTRVETAAEVLEKIMEIPETSIPPALLANAHGIAIIPGVIKVGLILGGQYGDGVLAVRNKAGGWSNPVLIKIISGSLGWQIGAESTDFVIVFKSAASVEGIMKGKFTLGGDASVAAGPVGRRASAATDMEFKAEIYSYSRSRGLFAGLSLEGSSIQVDHNSNAELYGKKEIHPHDIVDGKDVGPPPAVGRLKNVLEKYVPAGGKM